MWIQQQISTCGQLLFIQMNHVWSAQDDKPFILADWNKDLPMYIDGAMFHDKTAHSKTHGFSSSGLEPGTNGNCVVILYIRGHRPSLKMLPCGKPMSSYWLCKNPIKRRDAIRKIDFPSLRCDSGCLLIDNTCYEYTLWSYLYNDDMHFDVANFDVFFLNRYLANHGVKVAFMGGSTVTKISRERVQDGLGFNHKNFSFVLTGAKIFRLQKAATYSPICGTTMQKCDDGSCRVQSTICISDFKCAPWLCACLADDVLNHDVNYCRQQCRPGICACGTLMFQCSTGGCIPYTEVCDNTINCGDSSDEFCSTDKYSTANENLVFRNRFTTSSLGCYGFFCLSGQCIDAQLVNDLIPDCIDADDENHTLSVKYENIHFRCNHSQEIPCVPGHSKCFVMENLCVYDRDNFGRIHHCRDGSHLRNCRYIRCVNTFKCPQSYCIPIRKVCDGIRDCLNGDDEINCHNNICSGYLKCSGVEYCIHPMEVCDGYSHCPRGDDEELCDIHGCPTGCICLGRGVICRDKQFSYIPEFHFQEIIYLSMGSNYTRFPQFSNLSSLSKLVILDLSSAMVVNICPALQVRYIFYNSLHLLYLQHNYMTYLSAACFTKLYSLLVINLHGNPLVDIADDAFQDVSLNVLILSYSRLPSLSAWVIRGFNSLYNLDKRGVKLNYWSRSLVDSLNDLEAVYSDDARFCCFLKYTKDCQDRVKESMRCYLLSPHHTMASIIILLTITIFLFIMLSMWFATKLHERSVQWFLQITVLINKSLCMFYILAVAMIDVFYGEYYIFWYRSGNNRFIYHGLCIMFSSGMIMSNIAASCSDHIAYKAVSGSLLTERNGNLKVKKIVSSLHFPMITGFTLFTIFLNDPVNPRLSKLMWGAPLGVSFNDYGWVATGPLILSFAVFLSLAYSMFTYVAIFKHTYSSGKRVQAITSTGFGIQKKRLFKLLKNLSRFSMFRSLECLPIICIVLLKVCGTDIGLEIQLMSVIISVAFGCIGITLTSVWYPMFNPKQKTKT